jgi:hypothetical protein
MGRKDVKGLLTKLSNLLRGQKLLLNGLKWRANLHKMQFKLKDQALKKKRVWMKHSILKANVGGLSLHSFMHSTSY